MLSWYALFVVSLLMLQGMVPAFTPTTSIITLHTVYMDSKGNVVKVVDKPFLEFNYTTLLRGIVELFSLFANNSSRAMNNTWYSLWVEEINSSRSSHNLSILKSIDNETLYRAFTELREVFNNVSKNASKYIENASNPDISVSLVTMNSSFGFLLIKYIKEIDNESVIAISGVGEYQDGVITKFAISSFYGNTSKKKLVYLGDWIVIKEPVNLSTCLKILAKGAEYLAQNIYRDVINENASMLKEASQYISQALKELSKYIETNTSLAGLLVLEAALITIDPSPIVIIVSIVLSLGIWAILEMILNKLYVIKPMYVAYYSYLTGSYEPECWSVLFFEFCLPPLILGDRFYSVAEMLVQAVSGFYAATIEGKFIKWLRFNDIVEKLRDIMAGYRILNFVIYAFKLLYYYLYSMATSIIYFVIELTTGKLNSNILDELRDSIEAAIALAFAAWSFESAINYLIVYKLELIVSEIGIGIADPIAAFTVGVVYTAMKGIGCYLDRVGFYLPQIP